MKLVQGVQRLGLVMLSAVIVLTSSERIFWYWSSTVADLPITAVVYAVPVSAALWAIHHYKVNSLTSLILVAPVFAYVVEGVITPVLYSGGPLVPFFPAWFTFWHGFFGLVGLWYLLRRWLLDGRWPLIAAASAGLGLFWGLWSTTNWLPENLEDPDMIADQGGPLELLGPLEFVQYTVTFTATLAAAHWLWGRVIKPRSYQASRWTIRLFVAGALTGVVTWTVVLPWALPMFVVYMAGQMWVLRRHRRVAVGPDLLEQLSGRVSTTHLLALAPMPVVASASYALLWQFPPSFGAIEAGMFTVIGVQAVAGLIITVAAARRVLSASPPRSSRVTEAWRVLRRPPVPVQ